MSFEPSNKDIFTAYSLIGLGFYVLVSFAFVHVLVILLGRLDRQQSVAFARVPLLILGLFGLAICCLCLSEILYATYSGAKFELAAFKYRFTGPYAWAYILQVSSFLLTIPLIVPQVRSSYPAIAILVLLSFLTSHTETFSRLLNGFGS